ncbi:MAG: flagellar protein FlgN [Trichloromonadaceae bacterium]
MGMFDAYIEEVELPRDFGAATRMSCEVEQKMQQLLELILRERDCTRNLDMEGLSQVATAKDALLRELAALDGSGFDNARLAERVREENRRNAYLFWAGLSLVRDTMGFFGRQAPPPAYGALGGMVQGRRGGASLLSGRI